jgi:DNA repair exonuclease SbcCD ATPase subunit
MSTKFTLIAALGLTIASCSSPAEKTVSTSTDVDSRIEQLEKENAQKDSMINESLAFFSEIQSNLSSIELKKDEIRIKSTDSEFTTDDKAWILEQIKQINFLRQENAKKVKALSDQLKKSGLKITQLDAMVQGLLQSIQEKEEQISILESDLVSLDKAYARLFDAYQEKAVLVDELTEEINTVYYSYGTEEELVKNKVIDRKNGFIGIGKSIKLMDNFNQKYFAKIDLTEEKELFIEGSELKFITDHPSSSYSLSPSGKNTKIKISNPREFWKVSRYLVIVVD